MGTLVFRTLIGLVAGLLAWVLMEPFKPAGLYDQAAWAVWTLEYITILSAFIGMAVGGASGFSKGSRGHMFREGGLGLLFGLVGGGLGLSISSTLMNAFGLGHGISASIPERLLLMIPLGACLGAGVGAATLSVTGMIQGLIGGTIAGSVAGLLFNPVSDALGKVILAAQHTTSGEVGAPGRAILGVLLGALIALFIGLAQMAMRSAWLRLNLGRNEGKEWVVDRPQFLIGRSEMANVPLFGDPSIAPQHAYIIKHGQDYLIADPGGSPAGVLLNGQRVNQQALLSHGATIQLGNTVLQFLMKAGRAPAPVVDGRAYAQPGAPGPVMPGGMPGPGMPGPGMPGPGTAVNPYGGQQMPTQQMPGGMQPTMMSPGVPQGMPLQPQGMQPTMMSPAGMNPGGMPGMGLTLVAMDGPLAGQRFPLGAGLELGRTSAMVPMSYDTESSRRHATVSPTPMGASVQDMGSTNGTFVNNQRVQNIEVRPGDLIRVGRTTFRLES